MHTLKECLEIARSTVLGQEKHKLSSLVALGNMVLYNLLSTKKISIKDKKSLYEFITILRGYTRYSGTNSNKYSKEFNENTCDYKIARELVLRFDKHPFEVLSTWINHYYFDSQLWHRAIKQMVAIDSIKGLVFAVGFAQPNNFHSKEWYQKTFFQRLSKLEPRFEDLQGICIRSDLPLWLRKNACNLVINRNLLNNVSSEKYYLHLFTKVTLKAKNDEHFLALHKKEINKLRTLSKEIKR